MISNAKKLDGRYVIDSVMEEGGTMGILDKVMIICYSGERF